MVVTLSQQGKLLNDGIEVKTRHPHVDVIFDKIIRLPMSASFLAKSGDKVYHCWIELGGTLDCTEIPNFGSDDVIGSGNVLAFHCGDTVEIYNVSNKMHNRAMNVGRCLYASENIKVFHKPDGHIVVERRNSANNIGRFDDPIVYNCCPSSEKISFAARKDGKIIWARYYYREERGVYVKMDDDYDEYVGRIVHVVYNTGEKNIVRLVCENDGNIRNGTVAVKGKFVHGYHNRVIYENEDGNTEFMF